MFYVRLGEHQAREPMGRTPSTYREKFPFLYMLQCNIMFIFCPYLVRGRELKFQILILKKKKK
jgi:hypothetical protein